MSTTNTGCAREKWGNEVVRITSCTLFERKTTLWMRVGTFRWARYELAFEFLGWSRWDKLDHRRLWRLSRIL